MTRVEASTAADHGGGVERPGQDVRGSGAPSGRILLRTATLAWILVTLTLVLYLGFTLPYQKTIIADNMASQARTIAASISQVTATAIVAEDYSTTIEHCVRVVKESPSLRYVVITRRDGFSLVHTKEGWRQTALDGIWNPGETPSPSGDVLRSELVGEEVLHYTFPFSYSGIDWGWLHLGLSLERYRADLASLYRRSALLSMLCLAAALAAAFLFAKRLTRPIADLEESTRRVAAGDLDARVDVSSGDELERLAGSFNRMTAALQLSRQELTATKEYTQSILWSLNDALVVVDTRGLIREANAATRDLLGYSREELIGRPVSLLFAEGQADDLPSPDGTLGGFETKLRISASEREYVARDGTRIPILFSLAMIEGEKGKANGFVCVAMDIRQRKEAEGELRKAKELAEAASEAKSQFLANMSHEIRTPMSGVLGMTELLLATTLAGDQRKYAETAYASGRKLLAVLNDILDFSRIEAGSLNLEDADVDVRRIVAEVVDLLSPAASAGGLRLTASVDAHVPGELRGDPNRLHQILVNLVGNAVKFTSGGRVDVSVFSLGSIGRARRLRFEVADTGLGIAPEEQQLLFRPFFQVDSSSTRRFGGSGLGLAISRQLVEMMGGEIGVTSEPGRGSVFWFSLPLGEGRAVERAPRGAVRRSPPLPSATPYRVLLAEDNPVNQEVSGAMLRALGLDVTIVENGRQALEAFARSPFDLVFLDCQMPEMDGYETARAIRDHGSDAGNGPPGALTRGRSVPVIALTAHAMVGDREKCFAAGMDDYLPKPFSQPDLEEVLLRWLDPARTEGSRPPRSPGA